MRKDTKLQDSLSKCGMITILEAPYALPSKSYYQASWIVRVHKLFPKKKKKIEEDSMLLDLCASMRSSEGLQMKLRDTVISSFIIHQMVATLFSQFKS